MQKRPRSVFWVRNSVNNLSLQTPLPVGGFVSGHDRFSFQCECFERRSFAVGFIFQTKS